MAESLSEANLPDEPGPRPGRRRLPFGLLGMVALLVAVEGGINHLRPDFSTSWNEDWHFASTSATYRAPGCGVLCFGDSLIKYGVFPRVIEARTGLSAYNLACAGGTTPSMFFAFRQAIEAGARPRAIVIDFSALMLPDFDPPSLYAYPELATYRDCLDLAWASRSGGFLASAWLSKTFASIKWRHEIRGAIVSRLANRPFSPRQFMPALRKQWDNARGAQPMEPVPPRPPTAEFLLDGVSPGYWVPGPRNDSYLDRLLTLAAEHDVTVFWLMPPLIPEVHRRRDARGVDLAYTWYAQGKMKKFANLVVVDARNSGYDDSVHTDHLHLDRLGASVLSLDLGARIARRLGLEPAADSASSFVVLPPYAGRLHEVTPEALARLSTRPTVAR